MARKSINLKAWMARELRENPPRSKSLILTIFGDSLRPHVHSIWLADLMKLLEPFHINAQLTRTSAFRLAAEEWLESRREGRISRYSLTPSGIARVEHADHRIYDPPSESWDGSWTLIVPGKGCAAGTAALDLRRELEWAGYGKVAGKLYLHPRPDEAALGEVLDRLKLTDDVAVLRGKDLVRTTGSSVASLASEFWNLEDVAAGYTHFLEHFLPVLPLLAEPPEPQSAFVLQTLLIHSFRRVVLHDPRLPPALLPDDWPGRAAYDLCRQIYRQTFRGALAYLDQSLDGAGRGDLRPSPHMLQRLGGLL